MPMKSRLCNQEHPPYLKIDIFLPVANKRKMIMLINLERSLTFLTELSSVSNRRKVSSSSNDVRISTVNDSAKIEWSQKLFSV